MQRPHVPGSAAPEDEDSIRDVMAAIRSEIKRALTELPDEAAGGSSYNDYATGITRLAEAHAWLRHGSQPH